MLRNPQLLDDIRTHIDKLSKEIGPRPAASPAESAALEYIQEQLTCHDVITLQTLRFKTPRSWPLTLSAALALASFGGILPFLGSGKKTDKKNILQRLLFIIGGGLSFGAARILWDVLHMKRSPVRVNAGSSAVQIGKIQPTDTAHNTLVLIAHVDTAQGGNVFLDPDRQLIRLGGTVTLALPLINALVQFVESIMVRRKLRTPRRWIFTGLLALLGYTLHASRQPHTPGANDNASGVAALLALGKRLAAQPPEHTAVWLVFTGAQEAGCAGLHILLDAFGKQLKNAHFINVEMIGSGRLATVTQHRGLTYFSGYQPHPDLIATADKVKARHPVLGIEARPMPAADEIAVIQQRGYKGMAITGFNPKDDFPAQWHRLTDTVDHIDPTVTERVVLFLEDYVRVLDEQST